MRPRRPDASAVPWWGLVSAGCAPVLLVGGWTLAAARQPRFDSVRQTISALAARDATDRVVMTTALVGVAVAHVTTAAALRPVRLPGRLLLAVGGMSTALVAAFPLPTGDGTSAAHTAAAALAFVALSSWPAVSGTGTFGALTAAALLALLGWFAAELVLSTDRVGLAERVAAAGQAAIPLLAVLRARRS